MNEILHLIGFCPDHFAHVNLIDWAVIIYSNPSWLFQSFFGMLNYFKTVIK